MVLSSLVITKGWFQFLSINNVIDIWHSHSSKCKFMDVCGVTSCQLVGGYKQCRGNCWLLHQRNRGSRFLWNVVTSVPVTWCSLAVCSTVELGYLLSQWVQLLRICPVIFIKDTGNFLLDI
jgi:hypothetical protein